MLRTRRMERAKRDSDAPCGDVVAQCHMVRVPIGPRLAWPTARATSMSTNHEAAVDHRERERPGSALHRLVEICRDGRQMYVAAAEDANDTEMRELLQRYADQQAHFLL